MEIRNWKSKIKEHVGILLLFTVSALILTYPVIAHLTTQAAGDGGDAFQFKWIIWHVSKTLEGGGGVSDLYHTDLLFYPHGASLEFHPLSLTNTFFLAFPLTLITDSLVLIYNILFFFNFIIAGYAMYLLVKYLVKDKTTAFLVGFAYTFAPLHMAWGRGFLELMSFLWTPLFFLFFFKVFEEKKLRNTVMAAVFLFFLALASWYHLLFAFLIAAPYFIYKLIIARHLFTKHFFIRTALFLFLFIVIVWPFMFSLMSAYLGEEEYSSGPLLDVGLTPLHYFLPNAHHSLWGPSIQNLKGGELFADFDVVEMTVTPGYLVIFISLLYLVKARKHLFWLLLAVFFLLLSVNFQELVVPLLSPIPFVSMFGYLSRFSFGFLFPFLLFFAFSLRHFLSFSFSKKGLRLTLTAIIFVILVAEYFVAPHYPTTYNHERGKRVIGSAKEIGRAVKGPHPVLGDDFSILDFPPDMAWGQAAYYFQIFHEKPIMGVYVGRYKLAETETLCEIQKIFRANEINEFQQFLKENRVGYIILYDNFMIGEYTYPRKEAEVIEGDFLASFSFLRQVPGRFIPTGAKGFDVYEVLLEGELL